MPQPYDFDPQVAIVIARPWCPRCRSRMWLSHIEPGEPGHDRRTYDCIVCGHEMVQVVNLSDDQ